MKVQDSAARFAALMACAERMPAARRETVVAAARVAASHISYVDSRVRAFSALAHDLRPEELREALRVSLDEASKPDSYGQHHTLVALAPLLDGDLLERAFDLATRIEDPLWRARAIAAIAVRNPPLLFSRALDLVRLVTDAWPRAEGLVVLAGIAAADDAERLCAEALTAVGEITYESNRRNLLKDALETFSVVSSSVAITVARSFRDPDWGSDAFAFVLQRSPGDSALAAEALACARTGPASGGETGRDHHIDSEPLARCARCSACRGDSSAVSSEGPGTAWQRAEESHTTRTRQAPQPSADTGRATPKRISFGTRIRRGSAASLGQKHCQRRQARRANHRCPWTR